LGFVPLLGLHLGSRCQFPFYQALHLAFGPDTLADVGKREQNSLLPMRCLDCDINSSTVPSDNMGFRITARKVRQLDVQRQLPPGHFLLAPAQNSLSAAAPEPYQAGTINCRCLRDLAPNPEELREKALC
jgi:hypothetical protein